MGVKPRRWRPERGDPAHSDTRTVMDSSGHSNGHGRKVMERAVTELKRFVVMFLYLWLLLGLFVLNESIVLHQRGISFSSHGIALFNALVLAKIMLVAEDVGFGRRLEGRPLIYPILYESLLFTFLFIFFHVVEKVLIGLIGGETVAASVPAIGGGGLKGLLSVAVIMFFFLMPFFAVTNLNRELGPGRLKAMLFGAADNVPKDHLS